MKGIAVLLLATYAAFAHAITSVGVDECPVGQEIDWTIEHLMRHENCNMFYHCAHGKPVEKYCYAGLYFDLDTWRCEWAHLVNCTGRVEPTTPAPTTTTSTTTTTTPPPTTTTTTTTTPAPTTTTTTTTTPAPTTTTTTTTTPAPTTTTSSTTTESNYLENGCPVDPHIHRLLPHEYDCNLFYYCVWGAKVLRECPGVLHFNTKLQVCDHQVDAGCTLPGKAQNDLNQMLDKLFGRS